MSKEMEIEWIKSKNYYKLQPVLEKAYEYRQMIVVIGDIGCGKSWNFERFEKSKSNVFRDEIESVMDTDIFFNQMIKKFERQDYSSNKLFYTIREASNVIKRIESKSMYIIDEAGNFKMSMLKHIRDFRKHTKNHSALVLSGPKQPFYETLMKYAKTNKYGTKEFISRVNRWVFLDAPTDEEMVGVFKENGFSNSQIPKLMVGCQNFRDVENKIINYWIDNGISPKLKQNAS
ncbi:MAG: ATP-binding protein [bacterium]|nr:ATP-binding protein [bacterium]